MYCNMYLIKIKLNQMFIEKKIDVFIETEIA